MRKHLALVSGVISAFIGLTSAHGQSTFSNSIAALNPVAYWPLNETAAPPTPGLAAANLGTLGAGFNGAYGGNVTLGVPGALAGTTDTAAGFDGLSANVETPYASSIAPSPSFTIEAWLLSHNVSATQCALSDVDAASPRSGWLIYMDISNPGQYTIRTYNQNGTTPSLSLNIGGPGSIVQDQWYHLAVVVSNGVTATNVYAYIDGALVTGPTPLPGFVPNDGVSPATFAIGERSDNSFQFDGNIDEVAYYDTALDAPTIAAHYSAGTTGSGTAYSTAVLASAPILYFHLDEPASPVAYNYGSLGSAANGYYQTGTLPGVPGPSFGAFANGFGGNNFATAFSTNGTQSSSSGPTVTCAGSGPGILNITNSITISAWVKAPTNTVGWFEGVLGRGDNSYRFALDTSGLPHFADGAGNGDIVGVNPVNDGKWHYWTGTYDSASSNAVLYIDSVSAGTAVWSTFAGDPDHEFVVGGSPDYNGRNFPGEIAQVAIFTNVLTLANLQAVYNATAPSPYQLAVVGLNPLAYWPLTETAQPPATPTFVATNLGTVGSALDASFTGDVVFGVPGALASTSDSADGFNGSTTAAIAPYTSDLANNPSFTIEAWLKSHNIGATQCPLSDIDAASPRSGWLIYMDISNPGQYTFRAYAQNGTTPSLAVNIGAPASVLQDQWNHLVVVVSNGVTVTNVYGYLNGVLVAGPVALPAFVPNDGFAPATFTVGERSDDSFLFDGDIDEVAYYTNALDPNTVLAHYQAGTNTSPATAYSQLVLQQKPIIYYHLDEASAGSPYPAPLPVAVNYGAAGAAANGYFEPGTTPGVPGPFGSNSLACQFIAGNGGPAGTSGPGVLCDPYDVTILNATNALTVAAWVQVPTTPNALFETVLGRSDSSYRFSVDTTQFPHFAAAPNGDLTGTIAINDGQWHLWTGVYDPVSGKADLYIDGLIEASANWLALGSFEQVVFLGGAPDYTTRGFTGSISDVAVFTNALTQVQIQAAYATIGVPPAPPTIVQQPQPVDILLTGATLNTSVLAQGPGTLTYQWYFNTSNLIAGATSSSFTLAGVQATNVGSYSCIVSNRYGTTNSTMLSLTVISPNTYEAAAILVDQPLAYWPLNETSGTTAFDVVGGYDGNYSNAPSLGLPIRPLIYRPASASTALLILPGYPMNRAWILPARLPSRLGWRPALKPTLCRTLLPKATTPPRTMLSSRCGLRVQISTALIIMPPSAAKALPAGLSRPIGPIWLSLGTAPIGIFILTG